MLHGKRKSGLSQVTVLPLPLDLQTDQLWSQGEKLSELEQPRGKAIAHVFGPAGTDWTSTYAFQPHIALSLRVVSTFLFLFVFNLLFLLVCCKYISYNVYYLLFTDIQPTLCQSWQSNRLFKALLASWSSLVYLTRKELGHESALKFWWTSQSCVGELQQVLATLSGSAKVWNWLQSPYILDL